MEEFRSSNLAFPGNFRMALKSGKTLYGVAVSFPSVDVAKKTALTGYDWAFIDAEHAPFTPVLLANIVETILRYSDGKMMPVVRVPLHEPSFIGVALDAGAAGIILPHTETKEQAEGLVKYCRFPPAGKRSYPPWSWIQGVNDQLPEGETIVSISNNNIVCIAQIESVKGIENAEDIFAVDGIDSVMIGLGDLRIDMQLPLVWTGQEPEYLAAMDKVHTLSEKYEKPMAGFVFPSMPDMWEDKIRNKYKLLMCAADSYTLVYTLMENLKACKSATEGVLNKIAEEEKPLVGFNGNSTPDKSDGTLEEVDISVTMEA